MKSSALSLDAHVGAVGVHQLQVRRSIQKVVRREFDFGEPVDACIDLSIGDQEKQLGEPSRDGDKNPERQSHVSLMSRSLWSPRRTQKVGRMESGLCQRYGSADVDAVRQQTASLLRRSEISDVAEPIGAAMSIVRVRSTGIAKIGSAIVAVAAMSLMVPGEAAAKRWRHIAHHHVLSKQTKSAQSAMLRKPRVWAACATTVARSLRCGGSEVRATKAPAISE